MSRGKFIGAILIVIVMISLLLVSCGGNNSTSSYDTNRTAGSHSEKEMKEREEKEPIEIVQEISIAAIGDMLIHNSVYNDAYNGDGYDFTPMLKRVKPFLSEATISIANQETMIGGVELGLSSYPTFNSPTEVGDALKWAGVNVVSLANNHTLDRGEEAIQRAIKHWETIDMMYTGSYKNPEDREDMRLFETEEGISVAFLSYTYGTNGIPVPIGKDYLVNLIDQELMAEDIKRAKDKADVVVLSLHFGNEYERMPNQAQKDLVQFVADEGVDVVLGHHPHVLQPIEWVSGENGNRTLVIYSLGNFLSGQDEFYRQIGGLFKFHVKKSIINGETEVKVHSPEFLPTYVKYTNWRDFEVIPMYQLTDEELPNAKEHYDEIKKHMSIWLQDLKFIEE
ncbi:CapA family protein [Ornithinibacillus halotolerans]|uniref:Capsular polysaccharide biosynthesis protein n=1 Tax=Ornithinibacillus halotolerans TaxID=1274357 RepID=A0A916S500_9BACI|nr:CapA family protein [Ornithinibacillus halotolerans]GGA84416.1 capsular polysaccharide biosynthesis protein [Ornithinibacillus halotolerans]